MILDVEKRVRKLERMVEGLTARIEALEQRPSSAPRGVSRETPPRKPGKKRKAAGGA